MTALSVVVWERASRHEGLRVKVLTAERRRGRGPAHPFGAYLLTEEGRLVAVSRGPSAVIAADRAERALDDALARRVDCGLPHLMPEPEPEPEPPPPPPRRVERLALPWERAEERRP